MSIELFFSAVCSFACVTFLMESFDDQNFLYLEKSS